MDESGKVQAFNQLVRSIITLAFVAGFLYAAVFQKVVNQETFNQIVLLVVTWWFARDAAKAAVKESVELLRTPPPNAVPVPGQTTTVTSVTEATPPEKPETIIGAAARKDPTS